MEDLISVIVPIYNVESYVHKCVDSIINQTYKNLEIILVDDGSTDNSGKICDEISAEDSRVKVIHKKNGGLSDARNAGTEVCNGDYIFYLDGDDCCHPQAIEILVDIAHEKKADLVSAGHIYSSAMEYQQYCKMSLKDKEYNSFELEDALADLFHEHNWFHVTAWAKLYSRDLFKNIQFPKGKVHEDMAIMHRLFEEAKVLAATKAEIYYVYERTGSITRSKYNRSRLDCWYEYYMNRFNTYKDNKKLLCSISCGYLNDVQPYYQMTYLAKDREMAGKLYKQFKKCFAYKYLKTMTFRKAYHYFKCSCKLFLKQLHLFFGK